MRGDFRVGLTRDFLRPDGSVGFGDIGLDMLDSAGLEWEFLPRDEEELSAEAVRPYDALVVLAPRVTAATLRGVERLSLIARFGVGYDNVDVGACTREGVLLTITPEGVRRPVAASIMALLLAVAHDLVAKDRIARSGRWEERLDHMGTGLTGRTLGSVGLGNIAREMFRLAAPFGMRHLACDPYAEDAPDDVELVDLKTLLGASDFVAINCALTPETRYLIGGERLALMKRSAYLINTSRGPIVQQAALVEALESGRLAGAALDVFEKEPVPSDDPLLALPNVVVSPHALAWTDELALGNGRGVCESIIDVAAGRTPQNVVNGDAIGSPLVREKLGRYGEAS